MAQLSALMRRHKNEQGWLNFRPAMVCAILANIHRDPGKHVPFTPQDFMPGYEEREQTPEEILERVRVINTMLGGEVIERESDG